MPKILVTGGAGYIGSIATHHLLRQGYDVIVVDDLSRGHRHNVSPDRLRVLRLQDTAALIPLLEGVDAVMHFAAVIAVGESTREPEFYFSNNIGGSLSLFEAMARARVRRLVFSSTAAVYGNPQKVPIPETAPFAPVSPYGESKATVERILRDLDQYRGLRSIALRYFNACGAEPSANLGEQHEPETHLIPLLLRAVVTGEPIQIFGDDYPTSDGTCVRDYIHVGDLAEAHLAALEYLLGGPSAAVLRRGSMAPDGAIKRSSGQMERSLPPAEIRSDAFNVGTGSGYTVMEVLRAVESVTGKKVPYRIAPRRDGDAAELVADSTRLQRTLGWKPRRSSLTELVGDSWTFFQQGSLRQP